MPIVPLSKNAYQRDFSGGPEIQCLNRFYEVHPVNTNEQDLPSLVARSGTSTLFSAPTEGIARGFYSAADFFNGDLFMVIGTKLYRYAKDGTTTAIIGDLAPNGRVQFTFQAGYGYQRLFMADGTNLAYYEGKGHASGTLTLTSGTLSASNVIGIGGAYYSWGTVVSGTPTGSASSPFLAKLGVDNTASLANMAKLLNATGVAGTDYSINVTSPSSLVMSISSSATQLKIQSVATDSTGNSITTQIQSGSGLSWGAATLSGGGVDILKFVDIPDGKQAYSVASIASFVVFSISKSDRFYWLNPAETTADPLNFATAESQADNIVQILTVGDNLWLLGESSTEVWYPTGDANTPFAPVSGRAYARGCLEGTAVVIKDSVILVGDDGMVYAIAGQPSKISHTGIDERIRNQRKRES